ncbi:TonB-dependent receptor plug domain-containing protein [Sphingomonas sp. TX0543]|uniref:TonB-dependent receptor plug domain-containing protein n=1 Tax=unclassified Sphingomonas TaxID=196159 RepID=UPI0010F7F576|nr:TonB-dependent receptor [Sphingomonas sp. 3P27F8]
MKIILVSMLALAIAGQANAQSGQTPPADDNAAGSTTDTITRDGDVVVTATRSGDAIPLDLVGSSVTVITDADLQARQTRILSDALRDVPGVAVNRNGAVGGLTQVRIRGAESNHTLVFIDGIKADDPYSGEYDFGTLLNDEAARIEVLRGQQSSLYGSDAIGGVISYTTLSGRERPGYVARIEGGSMGTISAGGRAAGIVGDTVDYALSSSYYRTDGYPVAPGGNRDLGSDSLGATGKVNWTPAPNFKLTAVGRYSLTRADLDDQAIAPTSPIVQGYPVITAVDTPGNRYRNKGWYGLVGASWSLFDDAWSNSLSGALSDTTRDSYGLSGRAFGDVGRRYRASFNSTVRFGNERVKNRFTLAADWERQEFRNTTPGGFSDNSKHTLDTTGYVAQYDVTIDERLALGASARIDHYSLFQDAATYRATASYLLPTGTRLHGAYGTGIKAPTAAELFGYSDGIYIGNANLRPEKSEGWEAGVEQSFIGSAAKIGATYFRNRFIDQIDTTYVFVQATGAYLQQSYNNNVRTTQEGVEVYATARVRDFRLDAAYTYLNAPQTINALAGPAPANGGFQSPVPITTQAVRRPKNTASVNVSYAPEALPLTATLTVRYNGSQRDYAFNANYSRLLVSMKAFTLVNFNAAYDLNSHIQVFGRVENLLDTKYQEVFTFNASRRAAYGGVKVRF